jgi:hypothetical protein
MFMRVYVAASLSPRFFSPSNPLPAHMYPRDGVLLPICIHASLYLFVSLSQRRQSSSRLLSVARWGTLNACSHSATEDRRMRSSTHHVRCCTSQNEFHLFLFSLFSSPMLPVSFMYWFRRLRPSLAHPAGGRPLPLAVIRRQPVVALSRRYSLSGHHHSQPDTLGERQYLHVTGRR